MAYQIVQAPFMTPTTVLSAPGSGATTPVATGSVPGHPAVGYVLNTPNEGRDGVQVDRSAVLAPTNMPLMIPVGYVMYPGNIGVPVGQHGVQLASLQTPPAAKLVAQPQNQKAVTSGATKRPPTPPSADRTRKRAGSADSASSSTVSIDSLDNDKRDQPKRPRITPTHDQSATNHVVYGMPVEKVPAQAQTQFLVPGNQSFMVANSGSAIPINLLGYPLQTYPAGGASGIQTVQMAGLSGHQGSLGQVCNF